MRVGKILGDELKLTERGYQILLDRVDLRHAVKNKDIFGDEYYIIERPCICKFYPFGCVNKKGDKCPFKVFDIGNEEYGCVNVLFEIIGTDYLYPDFYKDYVAWSVEDDKKARQNIREIRKALKSMKKI